MHNAPVWISGVGVISGASAGVEQTLQTFRSGVRKPSPTPPFESTVACPTFQVDAELPTLPGRYDTSRTLRLTMHAIRQAIEAAAIDLSTPGPHGPLRVGICLGTTVACQLNAVPFYAACRRKENPALDPVYNYLHANLAQAAGTILGVAGPRMTVVNACSSGTDAIGVAASWLRQGLCDVAIAGGADEMYEVPVAGFWSLGVMSAKPCAPFDRDREGLNLGEGAGVVVMESDAFAKSNGRRPGFQLAGFGSASDAHHLTAPHPEGRGLQAAIQTALRQANIEPAQIAFINAHGTATLDNDLIEGKVLARLFGQATPVLSTKGFTGHTLGAAGGLEAAFTLLGLREKWVPASAGFVNASDDIAIQPTRAITATPGEYGLSTSLAFGGNNSAVIIRRVA